ncbi:SPFH domain-containing protein [Diaphorobacter sp. J5-51]|uniref:SPFH domain-containing protein n=1 Tax=Diaphorobacter sp. J5-51 TaxID=680496 RepID=UPI0006435AEA|nr:SPFH domain-containing protein [Diaphorobacter sp. J5-51]KLR57837.1 membrane protease subunit, stomatin/prohibitin [Diaphorobacter sp. J5-51]
MGTYLTVLAWVLAIFAFLVVGFQFLVVVQQQTVGIVQTLGKFSRVISPGFHFVFFPIQQVAGRLSLKIEAVPATVEVKTSNNMFVELPVTLMIKIQEVNAADAFYKLKNPHDQIRSWVLNTVRSIAANMTLEELFTDRQRIAESVSKDLGQRLGGFGYELEGVLVDQPTVEKSVQASFNRVVEASRLKEAAVAEAEASRIKTVKQAEAEADAQRARAQGLADSRELLARGMSHSLSQLEGVDPQIALQILLETNRIDAMRDVGKQGNLIVLDLKSADHNTALLPLLASRETAKLKSIAA